MGIWEPSMALQHCGTPQDLAKPFTTSFILSPVGKLMYDLNRTCTIAAHVSYTITQAVQQQYQTNGQYF